MMSPVIGLDQIPVYPVAKQGEVAGSATALQLPDIPCRMVKFKATNSNVGDVYLGDSGVTIPDGTLDATSGLELQPGDDSGWFLIPNLNLLYLICDNAGDDLTYLALI